MKRACLEPGLRAGDKIGSDYTIDGLLGEGHYGAVYSARDKKNRVYAVKFQKTLSSGHLREEFRVYQCIDYDKSGKRAIGIPRCYYFGGKNGYELFVMEMLGPSLKEMMRTNGGPFSVKTCLMLGIQLISRLEHVHNCSFLHRDIKPENILTGLPENKKQIYLADFGLAKLYRNPFTKEHKERRVGRGYAGTYWYVSAKAMSGIRASRRDDLESLAFTLVELRTGSLPWKEKRPSDVDREVFKKTVLEKKEGLDLETFSEGFPGMLEYMNHVRGLAFEEEPDYCLLRGCFEQALVKLGLRNDGNFDWLQK